MSEKHPTRQDLETSPPSRHQKIIKFDDEQHNGQYSKTRFLQLVYFLSVNEILIEHYVVLDRLEEGEYSF